MAIPPGNKLIGQVGIVIAYNSPASTFTVPKLVNMLGLSIVKAPETLPPVLLPKSIGVGAVGLAAAYTTVPTFRLMSMAGLAVVKYEPPTDLITRNILSSAVVVDTTGNFNVFPPKTAQIGVCNLELRYRVTIQDELTLKNLAGLIVVKYHLPYKTTSLVNIEYAASAKLNTEDLL